jgi:hypothetical protein
MTRIVGRLLILMLVPATLLAGPAAAAAGRPATVIDHMAFAYLPSGLGTSSDFVYDYDDVDFQARVWESPTTEGWQVDLDIDVMRGARLTSGRALHDWFIGYEERDPTPRYQRVQVHGHPGWLCRDQLFWLVRRGLAVSVHLDGQRWSRHDVVRTARSARETP